ncbi:hypothetical protein [Streptomonospora litoralis]|uniref:Uncharacterized protein n=1 Tax=Streptomonospora litoralis TaxID=2498135 RepID=A0A4P6Q406_9ACTN|nr:hypothetical protein [Streptomonospora litoralis]QBI53437.1 hypothetical protein EKD16_08215 [Streptomonospora litoralis]
MARIQVLTLPMVHVGESTEEPFALIVDQLAETENRQRSVGCGARTALLTDDTVDVAV